MVWLGTREYRSHPLRKRRRAFVFRPSAWAHTACTHTRTRWVGAEHRIERVREQTVDGAADSISRYRGFISPPDPKHAPTRRVVLPRRRQNSILRITASPGTHTIDTSSGFMHLIFFSVSEISLKWDRSRRGNPLWLFCDYSPSAISIFIWFISLYHSTYLLSVSSVIDDKKQTNKQKGATDACSLVLLFSLRAACCTYVASPIGSNNMMNILQHQDQGEKK